LAKALSTHKTIERADLSDMFTGRLKTEVPISIAHFVEFLIEQPNLQEIDLSDNALGPIGADALVKLFKNTSLTTLILRNNGLGIGGAKMIADALLDIPVPSNLRTIVIGRNRMECQGAKYLSKAIEIHTGLVSDTVYLFY
jgi:Ran GTPase-activating protein 1